MNAFYNVDSIDDIFKLYYQEKIKNYFTTVQLTKDNKVVVCEENISKVRLRKLKNSNSDFLTLEELLKYVPADINIVINILKFDERDYVYRIIRCCEKYHKVTRTYIYTSFDKKQVKQIHSMRRKVLHRHTDVSTFDPLYKDVLLDKDMFSDTQTQTQQDAETYVYGFANTNEASEFQQTHPSLKITGFLIKTQKTI